MSFFQSLGRGNQNQNGSQLSPNMMQQLENANLIFNRPDLAMTR